MFIIPPITMYNQFAYFSNYMYTYAKGKNLFPGKKVI